MFIDCDLGKGFKRRIQIMLRNHLKDNARFMYQESSATLVAALDHMVAELKDDLDSAPNGLIEEAREMFNMMLDNHKPVRHTNQKVLAEIKGKLLKDVTTAISHLMSCLELNVRIPLEEEDEQQLNYEINEQVNHTEIADSDADDFSSDSDGDDDSAGMEVDSMEVNNNLNPDQPMDLNA